MSSPIVTLTTDWGDRSFFAGMVKGRLYSSIPDVRVVDIAHSLTPCDLFDAAFVIRNACMGFPAGTVHIIDVLSEEKEGQGFIVVKYDSQYYLCTNNGLPYIVFGNSYQQVVELNTYWTSKFYNFAAYEIFCSAASGILSGTPLSEMGRDTTLVESILNYMVTDSGIRAHVWHIDTYGNAYLDIRYEELLNILQNKSFDLNIRGVHISEIKKSYAECTQSSLTVSESGYMEVAIYKNRAAGMLGLKVGDIVEIKIK